VGGGGACSWLLCPVKGYIPFLRPIHRLGGNAVTIDIETFFDSGAHRFHDKDPEITQEIKTLLGAEY